MQKRHIDRKLYFRELAVTSENYYMPYIQSVKDIHIGMDVLEIGCGEGGNLVPFSKLGCNTLGVDIAECRIREAKEFFKNENLCGEFLVCDFLESQIKSKKFDVILCHDVYEHIPDKNQLLSRAKDLLKPDGVFFISFPSWQMPFGGHQQICRNRFISHIPFIHLLPIGLYKTLLKAFHTEDDTIRELMSIKATRAYISDFEKKIEAISLKIQDKQFYFINPHYEVKFGLRPRLLYSAFARITFIRSVLTSSCFYLVRR